MVDSEMKISCLVMLLLLVPVFFLNSAGVSLARDPEGCLTCHRYPGLVRVDHSGRLKVLHIDEALYMRSSHGKFTCRSCHVKLEAVPHTGDTEVSCRTATCHPGEKEARMLDRYDFKNIHKDEQSYVHYLDDKSACRACHPLYPHSSNNQVRALLNMHTGFMYCETCHIRRDAFKGLTYEWGGDKFIEFSGKPFGSRYNPHPDRLVRTGHFMSRIEVLELKNGTKQSVVNTADTPKALAYTARKTTTPAGKKDKALDYFHRDIAKKEISVACNECHSPTGILDFKELGFDPSVAKKLININVKGLVTKYKTFYFPHLFPPDQ